MAKMFSPPKQPTVTVTTTSTSTPVISSVSDTVSTPAPTPTPTVTTTTAPTTTTTPTTTVATPETDPAQAAELSLARRERSINGTVLTSWRGVLQQTGSGALPARKRLLGE